MYVRQKSILFYFPELPSSITTPSAASSSSVSCLIPHPERIANQKTSVSAHAVEVVADKRYRVIALGHNAAGNRDRRQVQASRICRNQIADATSKTIQEVSRTGTVNLEWAEQLADDRTNRKKWRKYRC